MTVGLAFATGLALTCDTLQAADDGFYIGIGAGVSRLDPESSTAALTTGERSDTGFNLFAGYELNRWLSAEAYVADLGAAGIDFLDDRVGEVDYRVYGARALGYLWNARTGLLPGRGPAGESSAGREGASLYLGVGVGGLDTDSALSVRTDHRAHVSFAIGAEYGLSHGVSLRAELTGFDSDARYASLALSKRFGVRGASGAEIDTVEALDPAPPELAKATPPVEDMQTYFRPIAPPYLYFAFGQDELSAESMAKLDAFAAQVQPSGLDIEIQGHTDAIGSDRDNLDLSLRRALAVRDRLVQAGIEPERVSFSGFGERRPLESNATEAGRTVNRRADFSLR